MTEIQIEAHGRRYKIEVDPASHIGKAIASSKGPYEPAMLEHIYEAGFAGIAVDAGAHIGNHSLWLARICQLDVVAFEPVHHQELLANAKRNRLGQKIRVEPLALGDVETRAAYRGEGRLKLHRGDIPVRTLDSFELTDVALLKIDVEDMEPHVLRGGEKTIRRDRPAIFAEARDEACSAAIAAVLERWGYSRTTVLNTSTPTERWDA